MHHSPLLITITRLFRNDQISWAEMRGKSGCKDFYRNAVTNLYHCYMEWCFHRRTDPSPVFPKLYCENMENLVSKIWLNQISKCVLNHNAKTIAIQYEFRS